MRIIAATLVASLGLTACSQVPFTPENRIASVKNKIAVTAGNPMTVQWSDVKEHKGVVCGTFNAELNVGGDLAWAGPRTFVAVKDEITIVDEGSDCETTVAELVRCDFQGDEAKVKQAIDLCKVTQVENEKYWSEETADRMRSTNLAATGDRHRDQETWDAYYKAGRIAAIVGYGNAEDRVRFAAGDRFKSVYNAEMRKLPRAATTAQKVSAAQAAVAEATRQSEEVLREGGVS